MLAAIALAAVLRFTLPSVNAAPGSCEQAATPVPLDDLGYVQLVLVSPSADTIWTEPRIAVGREGQRDSFVVELDGTWTAYVRTSDSPGPDLNWSCLSNPVVVNGSAPLAVPDFQPAITLGPIAPTPVRERAHIAWRTPRGVPCRIEVYDVQSRLVSSYENDEGGGGVYLWDAEKRRAGVYLVRMLAAGEALRRKMVVLR